MASAFNIIAPPGAFSNHLRWLLLLDSRFSLPTELDTLEFFEQCVYPKERTWHNWLFYEFHYRVQLNKYIYIGHADELNIILLQQRVPTLLCYMNAQLGIRCYIKWCSNGGIESLHQRYRREWSPKAFKNLVRDNQAESWTKYVPAGVLFSPELDKNFYQSIIKFFDLEDHYTTAQHIHKLWYQRQVESEQEMLADLNNIFNMEYDYERSSRKGPSGF